MKWIVAIICLAVAGYCGFGFLATFEPGVANPLAFRIVYLVIGAGCLVGVVWPFFSDMRES